jgi:hypothetical protein
VDKELSEHLDDIAAQLTADGFEVRRNPLPLTYGYGAWRELAATDNANRRIWQRLGFAVHQLTSFHPFTQRFGALHCIAKELDRGAHPFHLPR